MAVKIIDTNALLFFWLDLKNKFADKVDKETGKSLLSDTEIARLATLANYDDAAVLTHIQNLGIHVTQADKDRWDAATTSGIPPEYITETELSTALAEYSKASALADYYTKSEMDSKLSSAIAYKGTVLNYGALPANPKVGDMYNITDKGTMNKAGDNAVWNGTEWDVLSGTVDLTGYLTVNDIATNEDIDTILAS